MVKVNGSFWVVGIPVCHVKFSQIFHMFEIFFTTKCFIVKFYNKIVKNI